MSMDTKLDNVVTCHEGLLPITLDDPTIIVRSCDKISTTTMSMATKLDRAGIYNEELPLIKLHNPSIMWFCEVT